MNRLILLPILIAAPVAYAGTLADVVSAPTTPKRYVVPAADSAPAPAPILLAQGRYYGDQISPELEDQLDQIEDELVRLQERPAGVAGSPPKRSRSPRTTSTS